MTFDTLKLKRDFGRATVTYDDVAGLQRGVLRRRQLAADLAAGLPLQGPRAAWLDAAAARVCQVLGEEAERFNTENQDDLVSTQDLCDVVVNVLHRLKKVAGL